MKDGRILNMIRAFVFDMDGVLTDTAEVSVELVVSYFASLGWEISRETVRRNLGRGMRDLFVLSAEDTGRTVDAEKAVEYSRKVYPELLKKVNPVGGAAELVRKASECGIRTAVASSAPRWRVEANILSMGLGTDDFDVVLSGEDVVRNKPLPDIYLLSAIKLGVERDECLVFEDTPSGIEAAVSAGSKCCALLTSGMTRDEAKRKGADIILDSLSHFPSFGTEDELQSEIGKLLHIGKGAKKYGANWITPLERKLPMEVVEKKALEEARAAMYNAYCPYSKFRVGAAVLSAATGRIYSGCNMENASFGATICAERNAITTAVTNEGAFGIDLVVISSQCLPPAQPCAVCLQVMSEFIRPETPVILVSEDGTTERYHYSDLLPHPFEFGD